MAKFFIRRPIVAIVIAIITVLAGLVVLRGLPEAQFPDIVPPQVTVYEHQSFGGFPSKNRVSETNLRQDLFQGLGLRFRMPSPVLFVGNQVAGADPAEFLYAISYLQGTPYLFSRPSKKRQPAVTLWLNPRDLTAPPPLTVFTASPI